MILDMINYTKDENIDINKIVGPNFDKISYITIAVGKLDINIINKLLNFGAQLCDSPNICKYLLSNFNLTMHYEKVKNIIDILKYDTKFLELLKEYICNNKITIDI